MAKGDELWHLVEARRDDGLPTIFRIRELAVRTEQTRIFVAELPYSVTDVSKLPDASQYRRFATFEEQWLDPACNALGWTPVAVKIEDGSFFVYLYGGGDPMQLVERLSPFDGALGFFDEHDPDWAEYAALAELLEEAKTMPPRAEEPPPEAPAADAGADEPAGVEHTKTTTKRAPPRAKTATRKSTPKRAPKRAPKKAPKKAPKAAKAAPKPKRASGRSRRARTRA